MDDKGIVNTNKKSVLFDYQLNKTPKSSWSADIRKAAFQSYTQLSWPTPTDEQWRRTDITQVDIPGYNPFAIDGAHEIDVPDSVHALSLDNIMMRDTALFQSTAVPLIRKRVETATDIFEVYNLSFFNAGYFIYIPENATIQNEITIRYNFLGTHALASPHTIIIAGKNSSTDITIEHSINNNNVYIHGLTVFLHENAQCRVNIVQNISKASYFFSTGKVSLSSNAVLEYFEAHTGGSIAKTMLDAALDGSGSDAWLRGIYFGTGSQHFDLGTIQHHNANNAHSRSYYKGAASGTARTVYQGLIEVAEHAKKTDAYLTNKNLILGNTARSDSIPSLKIRNNDVRCSHGSTTGKLNKNQLFYLMSRGLSEKESEQILVQAFFEDVFSHVSGGTADKLRKIIREKISDV
ncbi:MAG: Fe-S cluster assembly protein SufD [Spirochaetales bacterium]|nr:Fe-S cluster assembly protein SufD [Spirochaetales bacterium]